VIAAKGRPRPDPDPVVTADAAGVLIRFESADTPDFWLECRLTLAELDRLTALVEAEAMLDRPAGPAGVPA